MIKNEGNPYGDKNSFTDNTDLPNVNCEEKTFYGGPCYTQRASCISLNEKKKFTEKEVWLFPRKETAFQLKIPLRYQEAGVEKETDRYEYGDDFNEITSVLGKNILPQFIFTKILQASQDTDQPPMLVDRIIPKYAIETRNSKFPLAEYPFFRPEDQCSVPKVNTQGVGGVCYQLACREHDYCFQSLPLEGETSTKDFKKHFDFCNTKFKENLLALCSTSTNFFKKIWCYLGAEVFYGGVEYGSRIVGGKDGMGKDFLKSQLDQANYSYEIYRNLKIEKCSSLASGQYSFCKTIDDVILKLKDAKGVLQK